MERNFETVMIEQCAPVLASLKPAGLFRYETRDCADLARRVKNWNTQLNPKGLRVRVLKGCVLNHRYLVYVYRESKLAAVLADEKVQSFLRQEGYRLPEAGEAPDVGNMLTQLSRKLCCSAEFPHDDRGVPWLSAGRCCGLYREPWQELYLLRLLEVLRRPGCSAEAL